MRQYWKKIFEVLGALKWLIVIVVAIVLAIWFGLWSVVKDANVQIWMSKSLVSINVGDLLIILVITYFLFRK